MTFRVYGIRIKGDLEVRYVGQTSRAPTTRLNQLHTEHCMNWHTHWEGDDFGRWLHYNRDNVEAFDIAECETRKSAKTTEQVVIALCLRLNHRLFNGDHVPEHLRN